MKLEVGQFMGRGGLGNLVSGSGESISGRHLEHAWTYTRVHEYKRDIAMRANGMWVLAAPGAEPKMQTLEMIERQVGDCETVWGHSLTRGARAVRIAPVNMQVLRHPMLEEPADGSSFDVNNLGQWVPSREERTGTGLECKGLLRYAFEVALEGKQLTPDNRTTRNPLCLFMRKNQALKPSQLLVL